MIKSWSYKLFLHLVVIFCLFARPLEENEQKRKAVQYKKSRYLYNVLEEDMNAARVENYIKKVLMLI